jgi:leader peptidase (prepilin peptidase)/N-methyltransferase
MHDVFSQSLEIFRTFPAAWIAVIFVLSLLVGSFLNVVIHRTPIMLEREWKAQAAEILEVRTDTAQVSHASSEAEPTSNDSSGERMPTAIPQDDPIASEASQPQSSPQPELPERYNLLVPRSACPKCAAPIRAWQNIPVISWLLLRGKCANCAAPISIRYPVVELLTAVLSAAVAWKFGVHWYTAAALFFTWMLIALSGIDFDTTLLPDNMTLSLLWVGLLLSVVGMDPALGLPVDMKSSIVGAVAGYLSLWSVYHVFKMATGKEGMGYGDFKLLAALGAWLGWQSLPLIILLSAFTGAVVGLTLIVARGRDRNVPIPFGPYLAIAGWIALMWGDELVGSYLRLSGIDQGQL